MPRIAYGNVDNKGRTASFDDYNFDYDYPGGLNLKPGTPLHDTLVDSIMKRATTSASNMSNRFDSWNKIDETLTSYIDLTDKEEVLQAKDKHKPVSIVFPHSYAILETILGYLISAFFQEPIFRYEGTKPGDTIGAIMMEKIIDMQMHKAKAILNLHTQWRDSLSYGFGVIAPKWEVKKGYRTVKREERRWFGASNVYKAYEKVTLFEGNTFANIDPYLCLPDGDRPITEFQKGEYFGWIEFTNYLDLLSLEHEGNDLFNVKYLQALANKRTNVYNSDESKRNKRFNNSTDANNYTKPTDIIHKYIKIIPREWKVGPEEYPKLYLFSIASDQVLIRMQPLGLTHGMIPLAIAAPDYDGYSINPVSRLETLYGMQHSLDWMWNAHVANVRKAINDTIIYDPWMLNSNDLKDGKPGGLVRLRKAAWGRGVKDSFAQLGVTDITRGHVADGEIIKQGMNHIGGVDSSDMGSLRQGGPERLTGAEFKGTKAGTFTRLERIAKIIGVQSMQDLGYMIAHHTQQFMSEEVYMNLSGRWQDVLMKEYQTQDPTQRVKVSPYDILVDYDLKIRDGSVPGGNYSPVWVKMFEILASHPELLQQFDITKIFTHIARNEGAKNVESFLRVQQQPAEQVEQGVQDGNLVPLNEIVGAAA
jgi:hypothetical protein